MRAIPWSKLRSWSCLGCGVCCKMYNVLLTLYEAVTFLRKFGMDVLIPNLRGFYLRKTLDGKCIFQNEYFGKSLCRIQAIKPLACKLWPFRILKYPKYEERELAKFAYKDDVFYVYVDPACRGLSLGNPSEELVTKTIPEFIKIFLGIKQTQFYSTSRMIYQALPASALIVSGPSYLSPSPHVSRLL
ncbi:MAG: YkgJ family cysteine cluster protein [Candidatus Bathyarchaeia archaeon]